MTALIESVSAAATSVGPSLVAKATVTLVLMFIAVRLARQSRASVRHLVLTAGFMVLLVLPVAQQLVPSVRVEVAAAPVVLEEYLARPPAVDDVVAGPAAPVASSDAVAPLPDRRWRPTTIGMVTTLWIAGVVLCALPVVVGVWQARRLRRGGRPWLQGQRLVDRLVREAGVRRRVEVVLHDRIGAPAVCGITRPAILFPSDAPGWSTDDITRAVVHEVEHLRRADCLVSTVARLICALYWFHPLVWVAWRRLGLEAERACDDAVVRDAEATVYADQLVTLAGRMSAAARHPLLAMANRGDLRQRVAAVLRREQSRGRVGRTAGAVILAGASAVVMAIAPLQAVRGHGERPPETPSLGVTMAGSAAHQFQLDAVSVRLGGGGRQWKFEPGRMVMSNLPLETLVGFAFGVPPSDGWGPKATDQQIEGWHDPDLRHRRFALEATYSGSDAPPLPVQRRLVRAILEDRFGMRTHIERREQPVYALRLANPGILGPGIREVDYDCTHPTMRARRNCHGSDRTDERGTFNRGSGPIAVLVARLQMELRDRVVIDQTGLDGFYQWELQRSSRSVVPRPLSEIYRPLPELLPVQLGITIEETRAPIDVVVLDAISMPAPD